MPMPSPEDPAAVAALAAHLDRPIVVADVGCRWGFAEMWSALGRRVTIFGFDPDAAECERLASLDQGGRDVRFVPVALGPSEGRATLYLTREPGCSSLYPPDEPTYRQRPDLACITPVGEARVDMTTLDAWAAGAGVDRVDFLKLDTQGSELGILRGAERSLAAIRMLEIEVEFNPIYTGQPLFGDVDRFLRDRGFVLWRLNNLVHYGLAEARSDYAVEEHQWFDSRPVPFPAQGGQIYWGHAYYVRREIAFAEGPIDWRDGLRDACLAGVLGFRDLAEWSLKRALEGAPDQTRRDLKPLRGGE